VTEQRRNHITRLVFEVFEARAARYGGNLKTHPIPHGTMVLAVQYQTDFTEEEIDHVLVQLSCRLALNIIAGEVFFTAVIKPQASLSDDTIDWLYGSGHYAQ